MSGRGANGKDPVIAPYPPPRPPIVQFARPDPRATHAEIGLALANVLAHDHEHHRAVYGELDEIRRAVLVLGDRQSALREDIYEMIGRALREYLGEPKHRGELPSHHDWSEQLAEAEKILRARVKDTADKRMTSDRAKAIAEQVLVAAQTDRELSTWRRVKSWPPRLGWEMVRVFAGLAAGGAVAELVRWLVQR